MSRRRRYFPANTLQEVGIWVDEGLPFPCRKLAISLITRALAHSYHLYPVQICHLQWMSNHAHILVRVLDAATFSRFYGYLKKRLTDYFKRLYGREHASLWRKRVTVARILDREKAMERIGYLYLNPSKANLVEHIGEFPGFTSWPEFMTSLESLAAVRSREVGALSAAKIGMLPALRIGEADEALYLKALASVEGPKLKIEFFPNAWMRCFGITEDAEVSSINRAIVERIAEQEEIYRRERREKGVAVMGVYLLTHEPFNKDYTPKKNSRKIFVLASSPEDRIAFIEEFGMLCEYCAQLYEEWGKGNIAVEWPPGIFKPPPPMLANAWHV